jgi:DNA-binding transcriptional ArsR family regulator
MTGHLHLDDALAVGSHRDRRRVLAALAIERPPLAVGRLAATLAATPGDDRGTDGVRTALEHVHLPTLADADVVRFDHGTGVVRDWTPADPTDLLPRDAVSPLAVRLDSERATSDAYDLLRSERRRAALAALGAPDREPPASVDSLARTLAGDGESPRNVAVELVHVHLPKLTDAGVVTLDREPESGAEPPRLVDWCVPRDPDWLSRDGPSSDGGRDVARSSGAGAGHRRRT